ncbi:MAG: glycosyltransferase [Trebonia sp.]
MRIEVPPKPLGPGFPYQYRIISIPRVPGRRVFHAHPERDRLSPMKYPDAPFSHLQRLTDNIGLIQHADGVVPLHTDGYSVDDVARGLLVVCREPSPPQELVVLARRYLYFLVQAQVIGGKFQNHLGYDRQWRGQPGTEDGWGCSLWALGTAAARGPTAGIREESFTRFCRGTRVSSPSPHAMAFAALGAAEILDSDPGHHGALALLYRTHIAIGDPASDVGWPWPAPGLSYASAAIAEAVIVSGHYLGDDRLLRKGLGMLEWLLATETRDGHLSVVSRQGWSRGDAARRPASDQCPAEVAALADACMRAAAVTADESWFTGVKMCVAWFLGDNDANMPLIDERTGGCSDGLTGAGRSRNQGAAATLAMIAVLQHGRRMTAEPVRTPGQ